MNRALTRAAAQPVRFAEWLFSPLAPSVDLGLMLFAAGWAILEVARPQIFDRPPLTGLSWVSDPTWFGLHALLVLLHAIGLARPHFRSLRVAAAFLSAWHWLFVSVSILRVEMTTGVVAYALLGCWALLGGIYLAGLPPHRAA